MKDELVRKIKAELESSIESEPQVVYLLVEIRKLLEREITKKEVRNAKFPDLLFACDWIVHAELDRKPAQQIVRLIDQYEMYRLKEQECDDQFSKDLSELFALDKTRRQLRDVLVEYGLPIQLCDDEGRWRRFFQNFMGVISDCPLKCESQGLKYVEEVLVKVGDISKKPGREKVEIRWHWKSLVTGQDLCNRTYLVIP